MGYSKADCEKCSILFIFTFPPLQNCTMIYKARECWIYALEFPMGYQSTSPVSSVDALMLLMGGGHKDHICGTCVNFMGEMSLHTPIPAIKHNGLNPFCRTHLK